jgi:rhodanese-related sulfurtransferase
VTLRKTFALLLAVLALGCASNASPPLSATPSGPPTVTTQNITLEQARTLQAQGARLVDVRTPEEFAAGHLPGAVNLPVDVLQGRAAAELAPAEAPVVVYCRSGKRSARAAEVLKALGFGQVHDLGGMPEEAAHK